MDLSLFLITRLKAMLRLLPALAWLTVQLSMTAMPAAAAQHAHEPEIAALFEKLGVDEIVLCTPEGKQVLEKHDDHAAHEECQWCQGFSVSIVPEACGRAEPVEFVVSRALVSYPCSPVADARYRACHPGRAPPVVI